MTILYHLTILPPQRPACEALSQEVQALRDHLGGELVYLNPNGRLPIYIPRLLFGLHQLRSLRAREAGVTLHHVYNPDPFPFPVLRALRRPVVYSLTGGVVARPNVAFLARLAAVTVADRGSLERLRGWGLRNVHLAAPGIDTTRFTCSPLPLQSRVRLLVGSAPWTRRQFRSKGVDALLAAALEMPQLELVFLWRGVLAEEMARRVRRLGLAERVEILDRQVDVNQALAGAHAGVALATGAALIRAYPHSLMESLAAGKPLLVSRTIPMAEYAAQNDCGVVVESLTPAAVRAAVEALVERYGELQRAALEAGRRDFSLPGMIASYQEVYERVQHDRSRWRGTNW